jgi:transposase
MDETTLQVLKEKGHLPTSKSYMWVMRGGASQKPGVYFHYSLSRGSGIAQNFNILKQSSFWGEDHYLVLSG